MVNGKFDAPRSDCGENAGNVQAVAITMIDAVVRSSLNSDQHRAVFVCGGRLVSIRLELSLKRPCLSSIIFQGSSLSDLIHGYERVFRCEGQCGSNGFAPH